jgi:hypothetical protein
MTKPVSGRAEPIPAQTPLALTASQHVRLGPISPAHAEEDVVCTHAYALTGIFTRDLEDRRGRQWSAKLSARLEGHTDRQALEPY